MTYAALLAKLEEYARRDLADQELVARLQAAKWRMIDLLIAIDEQEIPANDMPEECNDRSGEYPVRSKQYLADLQALADKLGNQVGGL